MVVHVLRPERARLKTGNRGAEGGRTGPRAKAAMRCLCRRGMGVGRAAPRGAWGLTSTVIPCSLHSMATAPRRMLSNTQNVEWVLSLLAADQEKQQTQSHTAQLSLGSSGNSNSQRAP